MKGIKKFTESADGFLEKASTMLDAAVADETLSIEKAKEFADLIHKIFQSIKVMQDDGKKGKSEKFVSKVDQWADQSRNGTHKN